MGQLNYDFKERERHNKFRCDYASLGCGVVRRGRSHRGIGGWSCSGLRATAQTNTLNSFCLVRSEFLLHFTVASVCGARWLPLDLPLLEYVRPIYSSLLLRRPVRGERLSVYRLSRSSVSAAPAATGKHNAHTIQCNNVSAQVTPTTSHMGATDFDHVNHRFDAEQCLPHREKKPNTTCRVGYAGKI